MSAERRANTTGSAITARVLIVAGEVSGDNLAAALIGAVRAREPGVEFVGVTGPKMRAAGCKSIGDSEALSVMGLAEVVQHLPRLFAFKREIVRAAMKARVDLFVGVDAPEFNLNLAATLKAAGIPTIQYVSPQVWAWRSGRVRRMAQTLDRVLCLLPFESAFYADVGLPADFVGHPLADEIPLEPDRAAARDVLGIEPGATVVAILPGSRRAEIERLGEDFLAAARLVATRRPGVVFLLPAANAAAEALVRPLVEASGLPVRVLLGEARRALIACDVALVASGTATLETLLCKRPMVVAYRFSRTTAFIVRALRLVRARYFSQPNLLADRMLVPELLQEQVTPERLAGELDAWLDDPARVAAVTEEFRALHAVLRRDAGARAADAVLGVLGARGAGRG